MDFEEMFYREAECEIVAETLKARDGVEYLHEALSADNAAWLEAEEKLCVIISERLKNADSIDAVKFEEVGGIVTKVVFDYIKNCKTAQIQYRAECKIADNREAE